MATSKPQTTAQTSSGSLLGFQKRYNAVLYCIFASALFAFCLVRSEYLLDYDNIFCGEDGFFGGTAPGECYWYSRGFYRVGMIIHLGCILPAGALAVFQFIPKLRRKAISLHRINGRVIVILILVSTVGALMIVRRSFGGDVSTQGAVGLLAIMAVGSTAIAVRAIRRGQVDQHRAWMLRTWFYLGSIITDRVIMILAGMAITAFDDYYTIRPCAQLAYVSEAEAKSYPSCATYFNGSDPDALTIIHASFNGNTSEITAAIAVPFGMAIWLGLAIHAIGTEIYLNLESKKSSQSRKSSSEELKQK